MDNKEVLNKTTNSSTKNSNIKNIDKPFENSTRRSYQKLLKQNTLSLLLDQSIRKKIICWIQATTNNGKNEFEMFSLVNYVLSITNLSKNHTNEVISVVEEITNKLNYSHILIYNNDQPANSDDISMKNSQTSIKSTSVKNENNESKLDVSSLSKNDQKYNEEDQIFYHLRRVIVKLIRKTSKFAHTSTIQIKTKIDNFHKFIIEQMKINLNHTKTFGQQDISSIELIEQKAKELHPEFCEILNKSIRVGHNIWRRQFFGTSSKRQFNDTSEQDSDSDSLMSNDKSPTFVDTSTSFLPRNSDLDNQIKTRSSQKSHEISNSTSFNKNNNNKDQSQFKNHELMDTSLTNSTNNSQNNPSLMESNYNHFQNNHISECESVALIKLMDSYRKTAQSLLLTASYLEEQFKNKTK